ncbi:MAG: bifunctional riboflavin kinase/FAD synthetase [Acidimicrobiales bacterium]
MQVIRSLDECPEPPEGSALTLGFFDGVHLGHQLLVGEARRLAAEQGARSVVVTFDQHPAAVVRPESAPPLLTTLEHRLELLAATGVDHVVVVGFDEARSKESAEDFVEAVLVDCLRARAVVVGADFHFGHQRRGDVALLTEMGRQRGFEVEGVQLLGSGSEGARSVSSTAIRSALAQGDLVDANRMLGRPHEVWGTVHRGDARGKELGFPTANVAVPDVMAMPADGIYAGRYERPDGSVHPAAVSLGRRPTFYVDQAASLLEAHLLDFDGDLYGEPAKVRFVARLRAEERYDSVEELVAQMDRDCDAARAALA